MTVPFTVDSDASSADDAWIDASHGTTLSLEDYLGLIPPFNRDKPKFAAVIEALVNPAIQLEKLLRHLPQDFDLDEAVGVQLDVVGQWIGRSRFVPVPIPDLYFSFDDVARGFDKGIWRGPYDSLSGITRLDDDTYRMLLRAKIAANSWDGTVGGAQEAIAKFFTDPTTLLFIEDRGDGSMGFSVAGKIPSVLYLMLFSKGYIPLKPEGIKTYYQVTSINNTALFGFDVENDYVSGFDVGSWGVNPDYIAQNPIY